MFLATVGIHGSHGLDLLHFNLLALMATDNTQTNAGWIERTCAVKGDGEVRQRARPSGKDFQQER